MDFNVFFTFDCEDFINPKSIWALNRLLELLHKYDLKAIFFLTGHMCEKLRGFPELLTLLDEHEIGYHSTSHSVHPNIFEYTDIESYETAYNVSLKREQCRINPLTGEIEGEGGLLLLKDLFPKKDIVAYRAPGFCWSPPHLEALQELGIRFDFSTRLSRIPIRYKRTTFYPFPVGGYKFMSMRPWIEFSLFRYVTFMGHPRNLVKQYNDRDWDSIYSEGNPKQLSMVQDRWKAKPEIWRNFDLFLKTTSILAKKGILKVTPPLQDGIDKASFTKEDVLRSYGRSISWAERLFNYRPKFLLGHFFRYFKIMCEPPQEDQTLQNMLN
jgi:hypothetical protein